MAGERVADPWGPRDPLSLCTPPALKPSHSLTWGVFAWGGTPPILRVPSPLPAPHSTGTALPWESRFELPSANPESKGAACRVRAPSAGNRCTVVKVIPYQRDPGASV